MLAGAVFRLSGQEPGASTELYPFLAREAHEGVTMAARPLRELTEAERLFGPNAAPLRAGVLPIELLLINERAEPVRIALGRIQLVTDEEKFESARPEEIARALYPPPKNPEPDPRRLSVRAPKDKDRTRREEAEAALRSRQLRAAVIGPGSRARGFLYFDLRAVSLELERTRVYVPQVTTLPDEQPLFFFEISLEPYAR